MSIHIVPDRGQKIKGKGLRIRYAIMFARHIRANSQRRVDKSMPKSAKAPKGFYSATAAIKKLGLPRSTFYDLVEKGTIKKIVQPGRSDGYYLKAAIDDLAKARHLFTVQYATDTSTFHKAKEEDIQGLYDLCVSLWGTRGTYPYELRLARWRKNPDIFYVLKYQDFIVGYSTVMPIAQRAVDEIMAGKKKAWEAITLDDVLPYTPGVPIDYVFLEIAVRDEVPRPKQFGMRLLSGTVRVMEELARQGTVVKKLFGVSSAPDGIKLMRDMGFKETSLSAEGNRLAFELDVAVSQSLYLRDYQQILRREPAS